MNIINGNLSFRNGLTYRYLGAGTMEVVKRFQIDYGLGVYGIVGINTLSDLMK